MVVYVLSDAKNLRNKLKKIYQKQALFILSFFDLTPNFLSKKYYKLLNFLKNKSKNNNWQFVMTFYICFNNKKYLNALYIKDGQVKNIFGESFTNKNCLICFRHKKVLILFYFDVYSSSIKKQYDLKNIHLILGIDNDKLNFNTVFLSNKFFEKLVLIGFNGETRAENNENIIKKCENVC